MHLIFSQLVLTGEAGYKIREVVSSNKGFLKVHLSFAIPVLPHSPLVCGSSSQDLDVRISFDLCKGEREFLDMRKKIVSDALKKTLGLPEEPKKDEV